LQARALAAEGFAVLQMDLFGCGDSAGDFGEASWATWVADVVAAAHWLGARHGLVFPDKNRKGSEAFENSAVGAPLIFWGLRAGCLLAVEAARAIHRPVSFLFWQPVFSGEQYWRQFQRLGLAARVVAGKSAPGASSDSSDRPRDPSSMQAGSDAAGLDRHVVALPEKTPHENVYANESEQWVELSGYSVAPVLSAGLCAAQLILPVNTQHVACVELDAWAAPWVPEGRAPALSSALTAALGRWRTQNLQVSTEAVAGAPFWQIAESADCPALCTASLQLVGKMRGDSGDLFFSLPSGLPPATFSDTPGGTAAASTLAPKNQGLPKTARFGKGAEGVRTETALTFSGATGYEAQMIGVLTQPQSELSSQPLAERATGVLILVGGRQYRAGSHRQFVRLARRLASADFSSLRFDFHGMGDSSGEPQSFMAADADIAAAIAAFRAQCPHIQRVVLWGLCDAATAAVLYWQRTQDPNVAGLCLVNPWLRTEASLARARVRHYYVERFFAGDFWRKLLSGGVGLFPAAKEYVAQWRASRRHASADFIRESLDGLRRFPGPLLVVLSERDLVAKEFMDTLRLQGGQATLPPLAQGRITNQPVRQQITIPLADHTFSTANTSLALEAAIVNWLRQTLITPAE
jgi:exosortase A-associated hydrolase 1